MIAAVRQRKILHLVASSGSARVIDLARSLEVAEETIRRDLRSLSERGKLVRTHGGALVVDEAPSGLGYSERSQSQLIEKRAIADMAAQLIEPGDVIALDASSSACELARQLPDLPLTVVTNSLMVCSLLAERSRVETVCTGGVLDSRSLAFVGMRAERTLSEFNIRRFFFSCLGIDGQRGISEENDRHAAVKLQAMESAHKSVLLADSTKFGAASSVFYAGLESIDVVITDSARPERTRDLLDAMLARQIEVRVAQIDAESSVDSPQK
ncbi:MAG: DeoR/GlpR family DNA-binding transcription regulator [Phycisphaeraceae bacterium]